MINKQIEIEENYMDNLNKKNKASLIREMSPKKRRQEIPKEILKEIDLVVANKIQ